MNAYNVQIYSPAIGWYTDDDANGVNLMYAECIADYHKARGKTVRIVDLYDGAIVEA